MLINRRLLTTLDRECGKGYGTLVTKAFCKEFAKRHNLDLITFVLDTNYPSLRVFEKLKFRRIGNDEGVTWLKIKPTIAACY